MEPATLGPIRNINPRPLPNPYQARLRTPPATNLNPPPAAHNHYVNDEPPDLPISP